ncbi:MAG TPA: hypothetical protein VHU80_07900 [Polyangiaceae bacterium]|nr:hypothetical protein [Polyangiaceae bacterium]
MRTSRHVLALALGALLAVGCSLDIRLGDGQARAIAGPDAGDEAGTEHADAGQVPTGFSKPHVIDALSDGSSIDDDPSLTSDLLEIYFDSKRDGGMGKEDIWSSERTDASMDWASPVAVEALNSEDRETGIALSADGLHVWFSSDRSESQGGLDVFTAQRKSRSDPWSDVTRVEELSTDDDDLVSAVNDGDTVCLLGRRPKGTDDYDMYFSTRASADDPWGAPRAITELNTKANESDAFLVGEGHQLLFTRSKDLQLARRAELEEPFTLVGALTELNSSSDDRDPWATAELGYVVFSSDRSGSYELYESSR